MSVAEVLGNLLHDPLRSRSRPIRQQTEQEEKGRSDEQAIRFYDCSLVVNANVREHVGGRSVHLLHVGFWRMSRRIRRLARGFRGEPYQTAVAMSKRGLRGPAWPPTTTLWVPQGGRSMSACAWLWVGISLGQEGRSPA